MNFGRSTSPISLLSSRAVSRAINYTKINILREAQVLARAARRIFHRTYQKGWFSILFISESHYAQKSKSAEGARGPSILSSLFSAPESRTLAYKNLNGLCARRQEPEPTDPENYVFYVLHTTFTVHAPAPPWGPPQIQNLSGVPS